MKIQASNSFFKSLRTLVKNNRWYMKMYFLFRYDIGHFISNLWWFRKELWRFRCWDYSYNLYLFGRSLERTANNLEKNGNEVAVSRDKKIKKIRKAIELINNIRSDSFISDAEKELDKLSDCEIKFEEVENNIYQLVDNLTEEDKQHNQTIYKRAAEIENKQWNELWDIFKGQDYSKFDASIDFDEQFDGTGAKGWWD